MQKFQLFFISFLSMVDAALSAPLSIGSTPPTITLAAGNGGILTKDGRWDMWQSTPHLKDKINIVFYVAPSAKNLNKKASDTLKEKKYPLEEVQTWVVVNTASSWWPDSILDSKIKSSQEENARAIYLKDAQRTFIQSWGLKDESSNILVFHPKGHLIFAELGQLSDDRIQQMFSTIETARQELASHQVARRQPAIQEQSPRNTK